MRAAMGRWEHRFGEGANQERDEDEMGEVLEFGVMFDHNKSDR